MIDGNLEALRIYENKLYEQELEQEEFERTGMTKQEREEAAAEARWEEQRDRELFDYED